MNTTIDLTKVRDAANAIIEKAKLIATLPHANIQGTFDHIKIDGEDVEVIFSRSWGGETDYDYLPVDKDFDQPIEWWEQFFLNRFNETKTRLEQSRLRQEQLREENELRTFLELKAKYEPK